MMYYDKVAEEREKDQQIIIDERRDEEKIECQSEWTAERRLKIIREVAALDYNDPRISRPDLLVEIMFLCDMTDEFLSANSDKYARAIKSLEMGGARVEL